jgi:hypothetical protein
LDAAGLTARPIDLVTSTSATGIAAPSPDTRPGLRDDGKRIPTFGPGYLAGAADIARRDDHSRREPGGVAARLPVKVCSPAFQRNDSPTCDLVGRAPFGDAAASVAVGERRATVADPVGTYPPDGVEAFLAGTASPGRHWSTRAIVVPGGRLVHAGPYLRPPHSHDVADNIAVTPERAAPAPVPTAGLAAPAFTVGSAPILRTRLTGENPFLAAHCLGAGADRPADAPVRPVA